MSTEMTFEGLDQPILIVTDRNEYDKLLKDGFPRGRMLTPREIAMCKEYDVSAEDRRKLVFAKVAFNGALSDAYCPDAGDQDAHTGGFAVTGVVDPWPKHKDRAIGAFDKCACGEGTFVRYEGKPTCKACALEKYGAAQPRLRKKKGGRK